MAKVTYASLKLKQDAAGNENSNNVGSVPCMGMQQPYYCPIVPRTPRRAYSLLRSALRVPPRGLREDALRSTSRLSSRPLQHHCSIRHNERGLEQH